jgi:hypothetical protein
MDIQDANKKVENLPEYLYQGQFARTDELNHRILERNVPDSQLPPNFTPRPTLSKYSLFPMLDSRKPANVPIENNYNYSLSSNFTPTLMKNGPVSGFINNVQLESNLRNQTYALNRGNDKTTYVPSSDSDLYKVYIPSSPSEQPHPELFSTPVLNQQLHPNIQNAPHIGKDRFHNSTRVQLRQPL